MKRSTDRILTTHVGSLVKPDDLQAMINAREAGDAYDAAALDARIASAIGEVVRKQAEVGVDIVNDGEFSKSSWGAYFRGRLTQRRSASRPAQHARQHLGPRRAAVSRVVRGRARPAAARASATSTARCRRRRARPTRASPARSAPDR